MFSRWREHLRHALALRLGLWYFGLFVVSAGALLVLTYALLARTLAAEDHAVIAELLDRYVAEYARAGAGGLRTRLESDAGEGRHERLLLRAVTARGDVVYAADLAAAHVAALDAALARREAWVTVPDRDRAAIEVGTAVAADGLAVQVGRSSASRDALLANFRSRVLEIAVGLFALALVGGLAVTIVALAPVRALEATVSEILATGRFDARVPAEGTSDPLDRLSASINRMLGRIDTLVKGMRGALDDLAHDLRTPLTRFRSVAERALVHDSAADALDALERAVAEADRLSETLTALMDISQAETGSMRLRRQPVDLAAVVEDALALYLDEADDKGLVVTTSLAPGLVVLGDATRLRQACANLIENAVKYTPAGGSVRIAGERAGSVAHVTVSDTGIGIAAEDLPHVFDRLYRAERSRSTQGAGLGLSLVQAIVRAHDGSVEATSTPDRGTTLHVRLPLTGDVIPVG